MYAWAIEKITFAVLYLKRNKNLFYKRYKVVWKS